MKKTFLFALPMVSVMLLSGCAKKGKPTEVGTALPYAIQALNEMVTQENVGVTLTGSMDTTTYQKVISYNYDRDEYQLGDMTEVMRIQKLKATAAVKGLDQPFSQLTASASLSGQVNLEVTTDNIDPDYVSVRPVKYNGNINANGYLQEGVAYFDLNEAGANLVNSIYYMNTGRSGTIIDANKYYYPIPLDKNVSLTNDYILPWYQNIQRQMVSALSDIPKELMNYLTATKYSNTKYGLTMQGNVFELVALFGGNVIYGDDDTADGKLSVVFDADTGIQEIAFKYSIDYDLTFREEYPDTSYVPSFIKDHLDENMVISKGDVDLKMTFTYGNKVKVSTLKNKAQYNNQIPGVRYNNTNESTGQDEPYYPPVDEPEQRYQVSLNEFRNIFSNLKNNDVVPSIVNINGYNSMQGQEYKSSFKIYNGDLSSLTEEQLYFAYFIFPYSNKEEILQITTYTDSTTFECYVTSSGYELDAYQIGGDGRFIMKFNSHGHVTYFYLNSAGNVVEVNANYLY